MNSQLTKYECARIIGVRCNQLQMNAPILTEIDSKYSANFVYIAAKELFDQKLSFVIHRPLPQGNFYEISSTQLSLPNDLTDLLQMLK